MRDTPQSLPLTFTCKSCSAPIDASIEWIVLFETNEIICARCSLMVDTVIAFSNAKKGGR
jgi:hypothetical protein